jgi:hypothetical protein
MQLGTITTSDFDIATRLVRDGWGLLAFERTDVGPIITLSEPGEAPAPEAGEIEEGADDDE